MDNLKLMPIGELLGRSFYIPSYQRGYRWQPLQVEALLSDIWEYIHLNPRPETYCLQPIAVKRIPDTELYEVIDGQQRLTTIYLLLKQFAIYIEDDVKNLECIEYETRETTQQYLDEVSKAKREDNIDFFHIFNADQTIRDWFKHIAKITNNKSPKSTFVSPFLTNVKVIWYEVDEGADSIDIFTRLNIGKIPLTDAELIKALFLRKSNFTINEQESDIMYLKHLKMASEWNAIEAKLQSNDFWYFIYNPDPDEEEFDRPRIEYLFDLMANRTTKENDQKTFFYFDQLFREERYIKDNEKPDTDLLWLEVKKYFQTLEDWFMNREWFHLIGFLIASGTSIADILTLNKDENGKQVNKKEFEKRLVEMIKSEVKIQINDLHYKHKKTKPVLLLFNVITLNNNKDSSIRFPFDLYKETDQHVGYDVEHIRSQTPFQVSDKKQKDWIANMLEFFTTQRDREKVSTDIKKQLGEEDHKIVDQLITIDPEDIDSDLFDRVLKKVTQKFKEDNVENGKHRLGNLALLNADINRGYKNAMFPLKRKWLLEAEKRGVYIPLCTKNAFMKSYSTKITEIMYWQEQDALAYEQAVIDTLHPYLPEQNV